MNKHAIIIKNPAFKAENIDESIMFIVEEKVVVLHEHEKAIYNFFEGNKDVSEISTLLASTYENYNENDFIGFVEQLLALKILIYKV